MSTKDLRLITNDWPFEPGQINVRKIRGLDHRIKIQMRLDLGVLQMEVSGRPDGRRPFDHESLLDYHRERIEAYRERNGTHLGFELDSDEIREMHEEAMQYYQRYLANFVLEDYESVTRDTQRNLDVLDLCLQYAGKEEDRYAMEPYRPYILMMNSRSKALAAMGNSAYRTAMAHVESGLEKIKEFFVSYGNRKAYRASTEVQVLRALRREIRRHLPHDPIRDTRRQLAKAIREERYEDAARLRDQLERLTREAEAGE